jgi:hypothetical protein
LRDSLPGAVVLLGVVTLLAAPDGASVALLTRLSGILDQMSARLQASAAGPEDLPGSGITVRTEVISAWIPRTLQELAGPDSGPPLTASPAALAAALDRRGLGAAWYALTYRNHQLNGRSAEVTQLRRFREATAHPEELGAVLSALADRTRGLAARQGIRMELHLIPDPLLACDPRLAFARLLAKETLDEKATTGDATGAGRAD